MSELNDVHEEYQMIDRVEWEATQSMIAELRDQVTVLSVQPETDVEDEPAPEGHGRKAHVVVRTNLAYAIILVPLSLATLAAIIDDLDRAAVLSPLLVSLVGAGLSQMGQLAQGFIGGNVSEHAIKGAHAQAARAQQYQQRGYPQQPPARWQR